MNYFPNDLINLFFLCHKEEFTVDDFQKYLKSHGERYSKPELLHYINLSELVFPLINNQFVTYSGAFTDRYFSFRPSREEVEKGYFLIGHRGIPFCNCNISPDNYTVTVKGKPITPEGVTFTMNQALDTYAFFGEGYVFSCLLNDKNNTSFKIKSTQYSVPSTINLTAWPLNKISGKNQFKYGDRILCRTTDWAECTIEMEHLPNDTNNLVISESAIQRELWYSDFEKALLEEFEINGPTTSIEKQLALLFLQHQETLCHKNCGSCEEFLEHTKKIGLVSYGVESRIWYANQQLPFVGKWNAKEQDDLILSVITSNFSPRIIDAYLNNSIYHEIVKKKVESIDCILDKVFPKIFFSNTTERNMLLLNIEKRRDILKKEYNRFSDYHIAEVRTDMLELLTQMSSLLCEMGYSGIRCEVFSQQELIILIQMYSHVIQLIEEIENEFLRENFNVDETYVSLENMQETFDCISEILWNELKKNKHKGFEIINFDE